MSAEIELADTLCTTEDAFESFQAKVSHEEEEYVTLSDLVSPSDKTHAKVDEVTVESIGDENGPCESNLEKIIETAKDYSNEVIDNHFKHSLSNESTEHNILIETNSDITDSFNNSIDKNRSRGGNKIQTSAQTETVPQKRKRGRPKKCIETSVKDVSLDSTPLKTRTGRRNITETKTNSTINFNSIENVDNVQIVSSTINDSVLNDTKRKRRRPIKYANELVEPESISSIPVERDESSINNSKGKLKGVMKKKGKVNNIKSKKNDSEAIIKTIESTVDSRDNIVDNGIEMNLTECKLQNDAIDSSSLLVEIKNDNYLDETDDICLSQLKSICEINPINDTNMIEREINDKEHDLTPREQETEIKKRTPKKAIMNDIECSTVNNDISKPAMDIDNIKVQVDTRQNETQNLELEALDPTKRPVRRRTKQVFKYDEESDEDPFANVELSDDEPHRRKKGKYNSDDEYVPGKKYVSSGSSLDSDMERNEYDDDKKQKKWRFKKLDKSNKNKSPKKRINKSGSSHGRSNNSKTESEILDVDVEDSLESSVLIKETSNSWETSSNITDYLAKKIQGTDIKIMKAKPSESPITKFEIPVLNQNEPKKTKESDTQTKSTVNISKTTQTDSHQDLPMKKQVSLSLDQTEKACEFLRNIVETTAELGELMTQKSRDFIEKKINTTNVTDTFKMDYCVKKSFLLFKLAKHNLMQMEQDLETKYEEFLQSNNLLQYREQQKVITPQQEAKEDSDCEIVEEITPVKPQTKSKFNPKTVFLNKELSIKIAKTAKPSPKSTEKHNIKGRHTVWINESVMVKKVQPTQSFLAQDSRNKKPPDFITLEMVKNFFDNYYRQKEVLSICRRYTSLEWISINKSYVCNYFVKDASDLENDISDEIFTLTASNVGTTSSDFAVKIKASPSNISPKRLLTLCTESIQKHLNILKKDVKSKIVYNEEENTLVNQHIDVCHKTLYEQNDTNDNIDLKRTITPKRCIKSLKTICILKINIFLNKEHLETQSVTSITKTSHKSEHKDNKDQVFQVPSLSLSCFKIIQGCFSPLLEEIPLYSVNSLSSLAIKTINAQMTQKSFCDCEYFLPLVKEIPLYSVNSLSSLALKTMNAQMIKKSLNDSKNYETKNNLQSDTGDTLALKINCISSITEEDFSTLQVPQIDSAQSIHSYNEVDGDSINNEEDTYFNNDDNLLFANEDDTYREDFNSDGDLIQQLGTEDSNWVSLVQMQELRSCVPSIVNSNQDYSETDNQIVSSEQSTISKIKIEPEEPESDINVMNIKAEPQEEEEMPLPTAHVMTKEEHIEEITRVIDEPRPKLSRQNSKSYSEDLFESFVSSNKIIKDISTTYMMNNDEIYSQSSQRIRRQYEPDSDGEIDTFNDDMGLLVPQSIEVVKDQLMENSSDESSNRKQVKKKSTKPLKLKKNPKELVKDRPPVVGNDITVRTRRMKEKIRQLERKNDSSDSETEEIPLQARRVKHQVCEKSKVTEEKVQEKTKIPVQCSEVDSTEHISSEIVNQSSSVNTRNPKKLRISTTQGISRNQSNEQLCPDVNLNVPSELLECEPDIAVEDEPIKNITYKDTIDKSTENDVVKICDKNSEAEYIDRYGWKCYCINPSDPKIYENSTVVLEKLPESFVDTYLRFQDMEDDSDDDNDDAEVNRLINLASLTRPSAKDRTRAKNHDRNFSNKPPKLGEDNASSSENMNDDEHCAELTPSEDEDDGHDYNDIPQSAPRNAENCMAKNILMDDNESDSEQTNKFDENINIKQEPGTNVAPTVKVKPGPKSKAKDAKPINEDPVMLTANIMMNSELTLLHTPVVMKEETTPDIEDLQKPIKMATRGAKKQKLNKHKTDLSRKDESSSEEEKQWVYTKEKLLKRIEKKHETAIVDEVKGAKRVSEFIEKRGEASEHQTSKSRTNRGRGRSKKKMLERRKQMNVLAKELFGEQLSSRKCSQNYGKGRRNIRKVLNKQSLNHATVIANKEEFERKRRLNNRQAQLREHLGCEEGVNVVVINDELCLEYDFENNLPIVGVHKFFTQVMKAHQYEGVKFMWDACFESVSSVASGHPGGGCILAHCMGLGKTLQVLALLHTVLTHPMLNMRRVLVCCPLSTVLNWVDEIHKWIDPVTEKIKTFELSKLKRTYERAYQLEDWYNNGGIFIIGYELFRSLTTLDSEIDHVRPTYIKKIRTALLDPGPDIIVCDEGHLLKNDCSVLAVAMSRVSTKRRIVLTGTPMQNNLREYYCMVNFVKPSLLGTYSEYSNRFENPIMNGQHRDSREDDIILMKTRTHILHKVLEGCLQRQEASVLYPYLPKKYEYTVFIPLTKCQKDMYRHYLNGSVTKGKQLVLKDFHILQKIWTHPQVLHNFQTRAREEENKKIKAEKIEDDLAQEDIAASEDVKPTPNDVWWLQYLEGGDMLHALESSNKFHVVFQLLDECVALGDKVLIFSTSLYTMDALEHFLRNINKWSLGQEYYRLDGSVPADVRQKWCREFNAENNDKTKLFLVSTRAGCLGLNMTAANRVIILDTSWNPAHDIQSIFRVYRFGQKKDCFIYRLVAMGTMEQKIYERSVTKQAVACRVVDEQQIDRHFNSADLTELYSWDEDGWGVAEGVAGGVRDAALLRVAARGALHAVREHDSLLRGSEPALPEHERAAAWQQFQLEHAHNPLVKTTKKEKSTLEDKPTTSSDFASTSTTGSKVKKGKNNQTSKEKLCSAAEGVTPDVLSPDKEEMLVKKIMQILIENNFHETIQAEELTNLIVNVRRLVSSHMGDHGLLKDPIAAGIASVLLQDDAIMGNNVPDEQIIQDHVPSRDEEPKLSQRRKRTKNMIFDVENDSDDDIEDARNAYDDDDVEWTCDIDTKTLRPYEKRSKTKKTHLDKKVENIKDNQDTDENVKCAQVGNVKKVKDVEIVKHTQVEHVKATQDKNVAVVPSNNVTQSGSILISDDDDDDEEPVRESTSVTPSVPPKPKMKERLKEKQNVPNKRKEEKKEEERVPLHPMILTNENFIKIVAHMYQRGNSMLSDDAAKMAAQYSTNKARSEYEATGVPIISGPLYEIAIESLGLEQLRRMHETLKIQPVKQPVKTPQQPSTTETTTVDFYSTEPTNDDDVLVVDTVVEKKNCVGPKSRRKRFIEPSPSPPPVVETNQMITPEPQPQNVFPVGIFKGPAQAAKSHPAQVIEECILPDDDEDDDVIISSVVQRPVRVLTPLSVNNETRATRSSINRSFIDKHILPIGCQTLTTEPIQPTQVTPTQAKPPQIQITQIHAVQTKPPHIQSTPNPAKQTKPPQNQITPIHATRTKTPHLQITPVYPAQSKPPGMRLLEIDKTTLVVPESTTPAQIITSQELDSNEPICLSDSDDEIVEPRPVGSNNPTTEPPNAIQTASKNTATPVAPFVVQTASFKGSTPFILSEKARRVLDPNKKYYCIPASTFINKGIGNSGLDSSIQLDVQNRDNNISKPSIVITSVGQIQVDGASQYQTNNEVSPHVIISPSHLSTPPQHRGSNDQYANNDPSMKSGKIELITTKIYSASDCNNLSAETATNKSVPNAQSKVLSLPITSNAYIKNSGKPNVVSQASHKNRSPSPPASADHTQLFKDVVQIQADTYREIPKVVITKTKPTVVKLPLKNDLHHAHKQTSKSIAHTSRDRPVVTAKPSSTVFLKGSTNENGNNKLMILKKVEKMKDDNMNKSSSSSKVIKVDKAATKKMAVSSFIDLTDVPEKKQKVEKRPAPYIEKPVKKQKKLLTLADFTLDDIDDITELE